MNAPRHHTFLVLASASVVIASVPGWLCAVDSRIVTVHPPPQLVLTLSNLPPAWQLETTHDLTNWFSILKSGDVAPRTVDVVLTNAAHAQFYRVTSLPPSSVPE